VAVFTTIAVSYVRGHSPASTGYAARVTDGYANGFGWAAVVMAVGVAVIAIAVEKVQAPPSVVTLPDSPEVARG
jgi:hypothetical protein